MTEYTTLPLVTTDAARPHESRRIAEPQKTLRDEFAMAALAGLLARRGYDDKAPTLAFQLADSMIAERAK